MAVIDSRTAGILKPLDRKNLQPPENDIRKWMSDITGLALSKVVRRWLPRPGTRPGLDEDWCAVGVERIQTHGTPYQKGRKGGEDNGDVVRVSHQTLHCIASFYGPNAALLSDDFREGAQLSQNIDALAAKGLVLQGLAEEVLQTADFFGEQWVPRYDITFKLGRKVERTFGVRDIAKIGPVELHTEKGLANG